MVHLRPPCSSQQSTDTLAVDRFRSCDSAVAIREELASKGRGRVVSIPSVVAVVVSLESELLVSSVSFPTLICCCCFGVLHTTRGDGGSQHGGMCKSYSRTYDISVLFYFYFRVSFLNVFAFANADD